MSHQHQGNVYIPPRTTPLVDEKRQITLAWLGFLRTFSGAGEAGAFINVDDFPAGADVFTFTASIPGNLLIQGGTFNSIDFTRGRSTIHLGAAWTGFIPLTLKDQVVMDYTAEPDFIWFVPAIGVQQGVM